MSLQHHNSGRDLSNAGLEAQLQRHSMQSNITIRSPVATPIDGESALEGQNIRQKRTRKRWSRHALGLVLLLCTVVLWTASNFLASTIFANNEYSKPFFVTYINTAFFIIPLVPILFKEYKSGNASLTSWRHAPSWVHRLYPRQGNGAESSLDERNDLMKPDDDNEEITASESGSNSSVNSRAPSVHARLDILATEDVEDKLNIWQTARLSLEFSMLCFLANYFVAACLEYTTVASSTILTSTSSMWTLLIGAALRVEAFSIRKFGSVLFSLVGIVVISSVDISCNTDKSRGNFPHKTRKETAIGDALAFLSAVMYGIYSIMMKKRIGDEGRVNMPLFFGLVGLFNVIALWPGLIVLHYTGVETFRLPPTGRILLIVLVNSASSLLADFCWAYATLLTSPLLVTMGLSLTIPLSLVGQMVLEAQYASITYWIGAAIVFISFIFLNRESTETGGAAEEAHSLSSSEALPVQEPTTG